MEEESSNALDHGMSNTVTFLALTLIVLAVALLTVFITRQRNSRNRKRGEKLLADLQTNSANIAMIRFENSHFVQKIKCAALKDGPIDLFLETRFRGLKQKGRFVFHCIKRIGPGEYLFVVDTLIEDFVITGLGGSGIQGSVHPGTDPHSHLLQTAELAAEQARTSPSLGKQFFQVIS
ncbi:MAG TPA: hypothetical protein VNZ86_05605, partial [Bacteroidia bacterium]|nr:hypothetical protein [Bacteroidia bacterium]